VVFAFGPGDEGFYMSNGDVATWHNLSPELCNILNHNDDFRPELVVTLSLFPNGGYHIRSVGAIAYQNVPKAIEHHAEKYGGLANIYDIEFDSSVPTRFLFQTVHRSTDVGGIQHGSLPRQFVDAIIGNLDVAIQDYAIGNTNAWYMNGGNVSSECWLGNTSEYFESLVKAKPVHSVKLSPYTMDHFLIDYEDGTTAHLLPPSWQEQINKVDSIPRHHTRMDQSKEHVRRRTDLRLPEPKKVLIGSSGTTTYYGMKGPPEVQMGAQFPSRHGYEME
jgi:hypothetical protein